MSIADKLTTIAENVPKVYEAGKQSEYDTFWDAFQSNGRKVAYLDTFAGTGWTDAIFNPKYPINATLSGSYMFHNNQSITSTKVPITISASSSSVFNGCGGLKEIPSIKVTEKVSFASWFTGCYSLETINFIEDSVIANNIDFSPCPSLTAKSIVSIVEHLSDSVSGKTVTFKQSTINSADWSTTNYTRWADLIAERSNWTISLV